MKKAAAKREMTTTAEESVQRYAAVLQAKKDFISYSVNMGWQLALTVLIPVIIGVKVDEHFHTSPSYTLAALILAVGMSVVVIQNTLKQVNKSQSKETKS